MPQPLDGQAIRSHAAGSTLAPAAWDRTPLFFSMVEKQRRFFYWLTDRKCGTIHNVCRHKGTASPGARCVDYDTQRVFFLLMVFTYD
jgi:hypothetical protein